jgi:hypothetical protein
MTPANYDIPTFEQEYPEEGKMLMLLCNNMHKLERKAQHFLMLSLYVPFRLTDASGKDRNAVCGGCGKKNKKCKCK